MSIIYALVARGTTILTEHATATGNFTTVTTMILDKVDPAKNERKSYLFNRHVFHYVVDSGFIYLCMAEEEAKRRICFAFLADIQTRFAEYASAAQSAFAYSLNDSFGPILRNRMDYFTNDPSADKIQQVQDQINDVKTIMVENIEKVLERGDRIELLVEKTSVMSDQSLVFKKKSTALKRKLWWQNWRLNLIIAFVVLLILWLVVSFACGFNFKKCAGTKSPPAARTPGGSTTTTTTTTGG